MKDVATIISPHTIHGPNLTAHIACTRRRFRGFVNRLVDGSISGATYLGVTENLKGMEIATEIALEIRAKIKQVTGLNASAARQIVEAGCMNASDTVAPIEFFQRGLYLIDRNRLWHSRHLPESRHRIDSVKVGGPGREDRSLIIDGKSRRSHHIDWPPKLHTLK